MSRFMIRPLQHGLDLSQASLNAPFGFAQWGAKNFKVSQRSAQKRWGYNTYDRNLGTGVEVQAVVLYTIKSGTRSTLYLTRDYVDTTGNTTADTIVGDLCQKKTGTDETFKYITEMGTYDDAITGIVDDTVTATGTTFSTDGVAAGDYFILNESGDFDYPSREPLTNDDEDESFWMVIESVAETALTLKTTYAGTKSAASNTWVGDPRNALIRKTFKVPANERYFWMIAHDRFIFGSGGDNVKYWDGADYAEDLDSTYAVKARCGIPYANRVFLADYGSTRDPLGIIWSKEGDSSDWTDSTAGSGILIETKDFITGLGVVGASLVIYKSDSIAFGHRTGDAVAPISIPQTRERRGIGLVAPYSTIDFMGTNAFIGRNDFYIIEGDYPVSIGEKIRDKFFNIVNLDDIKTVYGFENNITNELCWLASTSEGDLCFAYDYKLREWSVYSFAVDLITGGKGAI
jgi:hypothetical protein